MSGIDAEDRRVVVPPNWWEILPREVYSTLERVETIQPWFEVYEVDPDIYVIYEPGQFEEAVSYLVLGEERAALVDTGCGIGDIKGLVEELTDLPVTVVNTHAHNDHVAQNYLFEEVAAYDDARSRGVAEKGCSHEEMAHLIARGMVWKPLPEAFNPDSYRVPPYKVTRWLKDGDVIELGNRRFEVVHTPGHSPDHICLLERGARLLWTGDIFYTGGIYTYLPGGDMDTIIGSYKRMIALFPHYDRLMPSHNEPLVEKEMLREVLRAFEGIRAGTEKDYIEGMDGEIKVKRYNYHRFSIVTRAD